MIRTVLYILVGVATVGVALALISSVAPPPDAPPILRPAAPVSEPQCPNCPPAMPRAVEQSTSEPALDLLAMPAGSRRANIASQGLGCCTFRSAEWAAHWQNVPAIYGLPEWIKSKGIPGGGTPMKQAEMVRRIATERNLPVPQFAQYEGRDPAVIELALRTGRLPCITWGGNHMLVAVHLDTERAAILDNNAPGHVQWMTRAQFVAKWTQGGGGWVFVLLAPPPPPPPASGAPKGECKYPKCQCGCGGKGGPGCKCKVIDVPMQPAPMRPMQPMPAPMPAPPKMPKADPVPTPKTPTPVDPPGPRRIDGSLGDWVYGGVEQWSLGDTLVTRAAVEDALADDSAKRHLTVIGTPEERKAALGQLGDVSRYLVQEYGADHWALGHGHIRTARVYLQDRAGKVLLRCDDGADLAGCLRRADPNYHPKADPSGKPTPLVPGVPSLDGLAGYVPWAIGAAAIAMLLVVQFRGTSTPVTTTPAAPVVAPVIAPVAPVQPALSPLDQAALELGRRALTDAARRPVTLPATPTP